MRKLIMTGVVAGSAFALYWRFVRAWFLRWGATDDEIARTYPGDENVPLAQTASTRAVTIDAPVEAVWPWLVQIGQHRAGFYSYARLENLAGCRMHNADQIVPEWQSIAAGDKVWLHPKVALEVRHVEPGRAIVLADDWGFFLEPIGTERTRFIVRSRGTYTMPDLKLAPLNFLYWRLVFEPAHFVMERAMMLGLKERAEREAARVREVEASLGV